MNPSDYAKDLAKKHNLDHALKIAEHCESLSKNLMTAEEVPGVGDEIEVYEETYKTKEGTLQTREKIRIDSKLQNKRLKKSMNFWLQTAQILRKAKVAAEQKKNAQT